MRITAEEPTCFSGSMLANPPEWEAFPPFDAIAWTSSFGRFAKLPGFVFWVEDILTVVCGIEILANWLDFGWIDFDMIVRDTLVNMMEKLVDGFSQVDYIHEVRQFLHSKSRLGTGSKYPSIKVQSGRGLVPDQPTSLSRPWYWHREIKIFTTFRGKILFLSAAEGVGRGFNC